MSKNFFKTGEKLIKIGLKKFRGFLRNPLFCLGVILVLIGGIIAACGLISPSCSNQDNFLTANANSEFCDQSLFLTQGEQKRESPNLCFIQESSIMAVSPHSIVTPQVLGGFIGDFEEEEEVRQEIIEYVVENGDNLSLIAEKFNISLNTLLWTNNLSKNSVVRPGQKLIILPVPGILHHVKLGDTLSGLAQVYKGEVEEIVSVNQLSGEGEIYPGDTLIIPDGKMPSNASPAPKTFAQSFLTESYFLCPIPLSGGQCRITQGLHYYNAVDFSTEGVACGQPVYAAASGKVLKIKYGYNFGAGNYVRILHPNGLISHYGHLSKVLIAEGDNVLRGQTIGLMGYSGYTIPAGPAGCHVHFAIHSASGNPPRNPFAK